MLLFCAPPRCVFFCSPLFAPLVHTAFVSPDFYGNCFNPRVTGLSVKRRCYFLRHEVLTNPTPASRPISEFSSSTSVSPGRVFKKFFERRHSFTDDDEKEGKVGAGRLAQVPLTPPMREFYRSGSGGGGNWERTEMEKARAWRAKWAEQQQRAQQFLLDPIFCEDPLCISNNVLRNAFRILQVLRAFSDAHRSLQASLEFTEGGERGGEEADWGLLQCILTSEDAFF